MTRFGPVFLAQAGPAEARNLLADASVYLITGGLVVLGAIVVLVLLRSLFPASRSSTDALERGRDIVLKPTPAIGSPDPEAGADSFDDDDVKQGQKAASSDKPRSIPELARAIERRGTGEPRILSVDRGRLHLRVYGCTECDERADRSVGCGRQAGYLSKAAERIWGRQARVRETACRRQRAAACEFEVAAT